MMAPKKGLVVGQTDFPLYTVRVLGDRHFFVAGGGGQAKTGIPNAIEIYELKSTDEGCTASKLCRHETGSRAIMNSASMYDGKRYIVAVGMDQDCQLYQMKYKVTTENADETTSGSNGLDGSKQARKRKNKDKKTDSSEGKKPTSQGNKRVTFDVNPVDLVQTDFDTDGFQKVVHFSRDHSLMITGGADGYLRVWKYPGLQQLYEVKAHNNEIDDLDISPVGNRIATVSRDNHAYIWNTSDGSKKLELEWTHTTKEQYRIRSCRFGIIEGKIENYCLFTAHIPSVRGRKPSPCYLSKWDKTRFVPTDTVSTGTEVISALAVSDDGMFLGIGTISGSVSVYISYSLQRMYHVKEAHNIFVTGVEFMPNSLTTRAIANDSEFTLVSISADNQIIMHQEMPPEKFSLIWVFIGFVILAYLLMYLLGPYIEQI